MGKRESPSPSCLRTIREQDSRLYAPYDTLSQWATDIAPRRAYDQSAGHRFSASGIPKQSRLVLPPQAPSRPRVQVLELLWTFKWHKAVHRVDLSLQWPPRVSTAIYKICTRSLARTLLVEVEVPVPVGVGEAGRTASWGPEKHLLLWSRRLRLISRKHNSEMATTSCWVKSVGYYLP